MMHSDRAKIEMVVRNLIHNALKYTDQGEVSVLIDSEAVPGRVQIVVRDSGTGIAAEDLPTLFEMFRQSSADLPRGGGVGLGLYIVKRLTAVLGGRVEVQSQRGVGSTFTVDLPLNAPSPAD
jgi:signal transduction histidine kinase